MAANIEGEDRARPVTVADLVAYFRSGAKPRADWRIGIEQEKLAVLADGSPVPYEGPNGISEILSRLVGNGFAPQYEDGHIISLERDGERITVEPGGQLELSGATQPNASACKQTLLHHLQEVIAVAAPLGVRYLGIGVRPFGTLDEIPWLPKRRYAVMRAYLPARGRLALEMMKRTATVQANFDYDSEEDAIDKMRTAYGVTSIVTALFAASPITEGQPNGYKSWRAAIWLETDEERCGLLPFAFEDRFSFADYVEWALDVPMFFVVRGGEYRPVARMTFRRFMLEGVSGERATIADWETHLSTLFPEVRLKRYIELRGADAGPLPMATGLGALWRGLLEDDQARAAAWALVARYSFGEREALRREVPRLGLSARFSSQRVADLAVELCRISGEGLRRLSNGAADALLLEPVVACATVQRSPADDMLDDFTATRGDRAALLDRWEIKT